MYRRFVNDLRDPRCVPHIDAPELVALEAERVRLVAAIDAVDSRPAYVGAEKALLALGDTICEAVRNHPEWEAEAQERVAAATADADAARRAAAEADRRAAQAESAVRHLRHAADDYLYPNTHASVDRSGSLWKADDPYVLDMVERCRAGAPL